MKTLTDLSLYLQRRLNHSYDPERELVITPSRALHGKLSAVMVEVTGSPSKGMLIIRGRDDLHYIARHSPPEGFEVFILNHKGVFQRLPWNDSKKEGIFRIVMDALPKEKAS